MDRGLNAEEAHSFSSEHSAETISWNAQRSFCATVNDLSGRRISLVWTAAILFFGFATRPVVDRVILR